MELRVNRFLSQAGLGSRRAVETWIREGRVKVNGERLTDLGRRIDTQQDRVEFDGRVVEIAPPGRVLLYHKPVGVVCSMRQQDSRPCLSNVLDPEVLGRGRLFHVGRLDADSSGLLLLTDDGDLAQALTRPSGEIVKSYELQVRPALDDEALRRLGDGSIELDGRPCRPAEVRRGPGSDPSRLTLELREGRNRQIRRMVAAVGGEVMTLHRTRIGPLELGDLSRGEAREASASEIDELRAAAGSSSPNPASGEAKRGQ